MAKIYDTKADIGTLAQLTPYVGKSPLSALSKGMSELDAILTKRDKEQYTKTALEGLKDYSPESIAGLDITRLTDAGKSDVQFKSGLFMDERRLGLEELKTKATLAKALEGKTGQKFHKVMKDGSIQTVTAKTPEELATYEAEGSEWTRGSYTKPQKPFETTEEKLLGTGKVMSGIKTSSRNILTGKEQYDSEQASINQEIWLNSKQGIASKDAVEKFNNSKLNIKALNRLNDKISTKLQDKTYSGNQFMDVWNNVLAKYTPDEWGTLSPSEKEKAYARLETESSIGVEVASYLREMSGTAASEAEALRTLKNMMGGGVFTSPSVKQRVLTSYIAEKKNRTDDLAKDLFKKGYQYGAGEYLFGQPIITKPSVQSIKEGTTATNPATGQKKIFRNGKWEDL